MARRPRFHVSSPAAVRDRVVFLLRRLIQEWRADRVPDLAAEVAFYTVLSLIPAFVALASVLGLLESIVGGDIAIRTEDLLVDVLSDVLTAEADGTIQVIEDLFGEARPGLLTTSLLVALYGLSRAFASIVRSLDVVYDIDEHRSWLAIRLTAVGLAIGSVVSAGVMLGMLVVGPLFGSGADLADRLGFGETFEFLWDVVRLPVALAVLIAWAATIFHVAPDHHTPWRSDLPGAVVVSILWAGISFGLRGYLEVASSGGNAVFGALGGILILLLWFWLLAVAVLVGGEINEILLEDHENGLPDDNRPGLPPTLRRTLERVRARRASRAVERGSE